MPEVENVTIDGDTGEEIERVTVVVPDDPEPEPDPVAALQAQVVELTAALEALTGGN